MTKDLNNLLIITYYFPPAGGPGVQRILKFIKYLPDFGWNPVVITVRNGDFPALDPSLNADIPAQTPIYRVTAYEPYALYRKITGKNSTAHIPVGVLAKQTNDTLAEKLSKWIRANLFIPDARIGWILPVYRQATKIIIKHDIKAVLSSSPPHSLQLAAKLIAHKSKLPWICDLRDPWTGIYYYQHLKRLKHALLLDKKLERSVLQSADIITTVSPALVKHFKKIAKQNNCLLLPNGYDPADMNVSAQKSSEKNFTLSYIGNLKANQNIVTLWRVIRELIAEKRIFSENIQLKLIGKVHPEVRQAIMEQGLEKYLKIEGYVPHNEAIRQMKTASVLLYIIPQAPDNKGILTGKFFEYLASGPPLFAIGPPDGDAARILARVNGGIVLDYDMQEAMKTLLLQLFQAWQTNSLPKFSPDQSKISQFNRSVLTHKLAQQLDQLVQDHK